MTFVFADDPSKKNRARLKQILHRPDAAAIVTSLRSIGYSFDSAVADVIDNSISASASSVMINLEIISGKPSISFLDNGRGMDKDDLIQAMRHGGAGVARRRSADDLGRYGLGLKTASLSQCRRLTVASIGPGRKLAVARWDLDAIERRNEWILLLPSRTEVAAIRSVRNLVLAKHGTVVIWENFDLALSGATETGPALERLLDECRAHLALVFQRFLAGGDSEAQLVIAVNGLEISGIDPFLSANLKTQRLPSEDVKIGPSRVSITPFILPQLKNINASEMASLGGTSGIRQGQGFYVYRNKRLIIAGTWFRMLRLDELTKLARVRIDIPNTMDELWNLDVKKSTATPPEAVRRVLKRIVARIANRSLSLLRDQGSRRKIMAITPVWIRRVQGETASYRINRDHPIILESLDDGSRSRSRVVERVLNLIELSVPYASIFSDMNGQAVLGPPAGEVEATLKELLAEWMAKCGTDKDMKRSVIRALPSLEPFSKYPDLTNTLTEAYLNGV